MGRITLTREHKQWISVAAFSLAALLLLDGIYQIGMHARWRSWIPETLAAPAPTTQPTTTQPTDSQPTDSQPTGSQPATTQPTDSQPAGSQPTDSQPADAKPSAPERPKPAIPAAAGGARPTRPPMVRGARSPKPTPPPSVDAAIRKRNPMTKPLPKGHGMRLTGVLGNLALFTTREGKAIGIELGKSSQGVKVTAMDGFNVTIEYEDKSETMKLFPEKRGPAPPRPPTSPPTSAPAASSAPATRPPNAETQPAKPTADEASTSRPVGAEP
jgi:hypothetical protein